VQQLYGRNAGTRYLPVSISLSNNQDAVKKRIGISIVKDAKTNDIVVKMVNLLPVAVTPSIDLKGLNIEKQEAIKTVLTGKPADKDAKPIDSPITVFESFSTELPPYSFTVIRIHSK
jgi:alpha-L-arabinofuranosidase